MNIQRVYSSKSKCKLSKRLFFSCFFSYDNEISEICTIFMWYVLECKILLDSLKSIGCKINSVSDALNATLCTVISTCLWKPQYVLYQSNECNIDQIKVKLHEQCKVREIVPYKFWDLVSEKHSAGITKRTALISKVCTTTELIELFCSTLFS